MPTLSKSIRFYASRLMPLSPGEQAQIVEMPITVELGLAPKRGITVGVLDDFARVARMLEELVAREMAGKVLLGPTQHAALRDTAQVGYLACGADAAGIATYLAHQICPRLLKPFALRLETLKVTWGVLEAGEATPSAAAVLRTPWTADMLTPPPT